MPETPYRGSVPPSATNEASSASRSSRFGNRLRRVIGAAAIFGAIVATAAALGSGASPVARHWTFLDETTNPAELGLLPSAEPAGTWLLEADSSATGARAMVNRAGAVDPDAPPATLLASLHSRDVKARTRCKTTGDAPPSCGIAFRFVDDRNHHVARLDLAERRVVVAIVKNGEERVLGSAEARIEQGVWQEITVEARGARIRASCNGVHVVDVADPIPAHHGRVGLWAPSASEASFDELAVEALPAAPTTLEILPLLRKDG